MEPMAEGGTSSASPTTKFGGDLDLVDLGSHASMQSHRGQGCLSFLDQGIGDLKLQVFP
jgi:hypothetical protein